LTRWNRCALTSVFGQTYTDYEVWVVEDCCTGESEQIMASFGGPRLHWFNLPQRVGSQSGPNNEELRRAQGKYVAYLGHDDLWLPWRLENLVTTKEYANAGFTHALTAIPRPNRSVEFVGALNATTSCGRHPIFPKLPHRNIFQGSRDSDSGSFKLGHDFAVKASHFLFTQWRVVVGARCRASR